MADKKNLAAGVKEMRAVAKRLLAWADDLEAAVKAGKVGEAPVVPENVLVAESVTVSDTVPASGDSTAAKAVAVAPVASAVPAVSDVPPTLSELKAFLTDRCAAGYAAQVKALIASYGVSSLSSVPEGAYAELMASARLLGEGEQDAG